MSKLDEIFDQFTISNDPKVVTLTWTNRDSIGKVKAEIKSLFLEIIGEEEREYTNLDGDAGYWEKHGRNEYRSVLRQKVEEL